MTEDELFESEPPVPQSEPRIIGFMAIEPRSEDASGLAAPAVSEPLFGLWPPVRERAWNSHPPVESVIEEQATHDLGLRDHPSVASGPQPRDDQREMLRDARDGVASRE